MSREDVLKRINEICQDIFFDDELAITEATTASDVEGWDSLTHLQLISEVEKEYGIRFTMGEIQGFSNVGELISVVLKRVANK